MAIDLLTLAQFERAVELFLTRYDPSQATLTTFSGNLNTLATDGFYVVEVAATNKPSGVTTGVVVVFTPESNKILQLFFDVAGNNQNALYRSSVDNGSTWSAWVDFATVIGNAATAAANAVTANLQSLLDQATAQATAAAGSATAAAESNRLAGLAQAAAQGAATTAATDATTAVQTALQDLVGDAEDARDEAQAAQAAAQAAVASTGDNPQFAQYDVVIGPTGTLVPTGTLLYQSLTAYFNANQTSNGHRILVLEGIWGWATSTNISNIQVVDGANRRAHANTNLVIEGVGAKAQLSMQLGGVVIAGHGWKVHNVRLSDFNSNGLRLGGDDHDWDVWSDSSNTSSSGVPNWAVWLGARTSFRAAEFARTSAAEIDTILDQTPLRVAGLFGIVSISPYTLQRYRGFTPTRMQKSGNRFFLEFSIPTFILFSSVDGAVGFWLYPGASWTSRTDSGKFKSRWWVCQPYDANSNFPTVSQTWRFEVFI